MELAYIALNGGTRTCTKLIGRSKTVREEFFSDPLYQVRSSFSCFSVNIIHELCIYTYRTYLSTSSHSPLQITTTPNPQPTLPIHSSPLLSQWTSAPAPQPSVSIATTRTIMLATSALPATRTSHIGTCSSVSSCLDAIPRKR